MGSQYAAPENPIFQSKNRFLTVSALENPQDFSGNWRGWQWRGAHEARAQWAKQREVSPMSNGTLQAARRSKTTIANCGTKPFRASIVPGGVYGGDGAIFAAENPIFQSKNRFLTVSAPGNP